MRLSNFLLVGALATLAALAPPAHAQAAAQAAAEPAAGAPSRPRVGLVLSGGGARGAAHAGVYRALLEHGEPVDAIGGASMGAVFGALMAFDTTGDEVVDTFARHFADNPTGDFSVWPMLSLLGRTRMPLIAQTRSMSSTVRAYWNCGCSWSARANSAVWLMEGR